MNYLAMKINFHSTFRNERIRNSRGKSRRKIYEKIFVSCDNAAAMEREGGGKHGKNQMIDVPTMISHNLHRSTQCLFSLASFYGVRSTMNEIYQFHFSPFLPPTQFQRCLNRMINLDTFCCCEK